MKFWHKLSKGDVVDIIAPSAGNITPNQISLIVSFLEKNYLTPRISEDIFNNQFPYYANSDEYRFNKLIESLQAKDSKAVWCIRGGYGSTRIVNKIKANLKPKICKALIGFSDITALHLTLNTKWNWSTLHAPVLFQVAENLVNSKSIDTIISCILGNIDKITYLDLEPLNNLANINKTINSSVIGGNLSVINSSLATNWQINAKNKILFLEDVSERGYSIDRMLNHLDQAGIFKQVKAIIFGSFTDGLEKDGKDFTKYAIEDFSKKIDIPVLQCKSIGHNENNITLPLNTKTVLKLGLNPSMTCEVGFK